MSFGGFERGVSPSQPMSEINVTPLVDVMLVLLVIFIITAPLLAYAIKIDLPQTDAAPAAARPDAIKLSLNGAGQFFWNSEAIAERELARRLGAAAKRQPQPELHLYADRATRYEQLARVLSAAQQAGITRMGFVTEPEPNETRSTPQRE